MNLWSDTTSFLAQPFKSGNDAWQWVLFVGLLIIAAFMWNLVLLHIVHDVE